MISIISFSSTEIQKHFCENNSWASFSFFTLGWSILMEIDDMKAFLAELKDDPFPFSSKMVGKLNSSHFTPSEKEADFALKNPIFFAKHRNLVFCCWVHCSDFQCIIGQSFGFNMLLLIRLFFSLNKQDEWLEIYNTVEVHVPHAPTDLSTFDRSQMRMYTTSKCSQSSLWSLTHSSSNWLKVIIANLFL